VPQLNPRLTMTVVGAAIVAVLGGALYFGSGPAATVTSEIPAAQPRAARLVVHVSGAVVRPGLVSLGEPARVADAIDAAGGATTTADLGALNLAGPVRDGDQIDVPNVGERDDAEDGLVDLNEATAQQLANLHGIGPVLADRIVAYREEHGRFEVVEDLLDVPGIGEAKLALLRPGVSAP